METTNIGEIARRALVVMLVVGLCLLTVQFAFVFMLIFSAVLVAALIRAAGWPFRRMGASDTLSVFCGLFLILAVLGGAGWLFGAQLSEQFTEVGQQLPQAFEKARAMAAQVPFLQSFLSGTPDFQGVASRALSFAFGAVGAITNLVLVIVAAMYLALEPGIYMRGVEKLFPKEKGRQVREALSASGQALNKWLIAQGATMLIVGVLIWGGLSIVGVQSAGALGVISGLTNFIPLVGPFIGAAPGVLLGLSQGTDTLIWTCVVYLVAQQLEGNVLTPIIQKYAVSIPPAVLMFALAALGSMFGFIGVIVAAPLAVVLYVLVALLWVRDTLGHHAEIDGIEAPPPPDSNAPEAGGETKPA
ncbi:AI-2E family transporter [Sphingomonas yantingensis]|uniref:Putative PurR-regulated permease PerM n=1 Tax=Sphingomonas yantingensis TaxID=1241761 RepID=A0A7W9AP37_9SPHN|nr:AI-2E family transporter [Sphingomonas yantingensis]MBB5697811.1 putative PurR-regulated permease PerM [Sphingomonas yantingensis]